MAASTIKEAISRHDVDFTAPQTPVTSAPIVAGFLSNLPAYRIGVSPLLRGVEIGLVHGFLVTGVFELGFGQGSVIQMHLHASTVPCNVLPSLSTPMVQPR